MKPINWNRPEDELDKSVWDRLTSNFWLPEKIPVSNDVKTWVHMTPEEQRVIKLVFAQLTMLDTLQSEKGITQLYDLAFSQHEAAVLANVQFMEAFKEGTELLTSTGWVKIEEITEDHSVAQYDPETNTISFAAPTLTPMLYFDELYKIAQPNGNATQIVSPGHRVYYEESNQKSGRIRDWMPRTVNATNFHTIPNTSYYQLRESAPTAKRGLGMTAEDRLLVAIAADGSISGERYTGEIAGTIPCRFSFAKSRKWERFLRLADEAGWRVRETTQTGDKRNFYLDVPKHYVQDRNKKLKSWWNVGEQSLEWILDFIDEIGHWDGHKHQNYGTTFYTTDKDDSDFVVAAATLAGMHSRTNVREDNRKDTYNDSYVTYISNRNTYSMQSMSVTEVEGGNVYCVQVPTSYVVTRNGPSPVISGNCVHAKSYSTIFSTLCSMKEIDELFRWAETDELLQTQAAALLAAYSSDSPYRRRAASVMLESMLFYTGFYAPLRMASEGKLTNTADIIRLILRDEGVHGFYIGYKAQKCNPTPHDEAWVYQFMNQLYKVEVERIRDIYDPVGWSTDVVKFLRYNANKALVNLGLTPVFTDDQANVSAAILSSLDIGTSETHDFFSGSGASYVIGKAEDTTDDDWSF